MVDTIAGGRSATITLPLLPLPGGVVFPGMVVTIAIDSAQATAAFTAAPAAGGRLLLVPRVDDRYAAVGTVVKVEQTDRLPGGRRGALVRGLARARITTGTTAPDDAPASGSTTWVEATVADDEVTDAERVEELATEYRALVEGILQRRGAGRIAQAIEEITDPGQLADTAVYSPDLSLEQKVDVLETVDLVARFEKVVGWARETLADLEVRQRIQDDVTDKMERKQREYILRQQLEAIRKELAEVTGDEGDGDALADYRRRAETLPETVRTFVVKEIDRLERTGEQSPEQSWIRTWLDRILELPWNERSEDRLDLEEARAILDADHTGLVEVKDRIIEQLAVRKLRKERGLDGTPPAAGHPAADGTEEAPLTTATPASTRGHGAILALVGPPGVGKTSLGESVARALGRKFVRVALGGVRDEAEIRGHRRTYVGAQQGRIARAIAEAGTMNPVMLLDEIDKVGSDWRGDPSSALLEVLDPAQNHTFRDHYLEVDLDLSDVLFLATANVVETIPAPLLDRMEVVNLDGYTDVEKVEIARQHLLPRQLTRTGLGLDEVEISDEVLRRVVEGWTREAGVRQLERQLGKLARKVATKIAGGVEAPVVVEEPAPWLGRQRVFPEVAERTTIPGVVTGLAVTGTGGDVLFVEATLLPGEGGRDGLRLTGQLGDVMKESASIARSFVEANAAELGCRHEPLQGQRRARPRAGRRDPEGRAERRA